MSIGSTIRMLRKSKGVTQEELANALVITYQSVSKWENYVAYHGIAFAMATAVKLYDKYDVCVNVAYDRKKEDSRGRSICGHTIKEKERVVIIDDLVNSGRCTLDLIDKIKSMADVAVVAVVTIANENSGTSEMYKMVNEYGIRFYSIICDEDIKHYRRKNF